ncbi:MAG TPA: hypothetical protein VIN09_12820, partial [Chloroflexota bacterium]
MKTVELVLRFIGGVLGAAGGWLAGRELIDLLAWNHLSSYYLDLVFPVVAAVVCFVGAFALT